MGFFNKKNNTIEENKNMIDKNVKNYNVLDFSNLLKINNQNLNRILNSVNDESIFLDEDLRLICKREVEHFEERYQCKIEGLIPLIDISNNDFIVYICAKNTFGIYNIVDELLLEEDVDITEIINKLDLYNK
jgi:hypothetical protein